MIRGAPTKPRTAQTQEYERRAPAPRLEYYVSQGRPGEGFGEAVIRGLGGAQKRIDSRFFYDARGSEIFERICELPEYYLTRAESEILASHAPEAVSMMGGRSRLVELGSGSSTKTRMILECMHAAQGRVTYLPIDVSGVLESSSRSLLESYAWLDIVAVRDTYEAGLRFAHARGGEPALIAFLGSSLGNMDADGARRFLGSVASSMHDKDMLLIGLDLDKGEEALRGAYDDRAGVTAEFNLNLLHRINSELGGGIDISMFEHHVKYNASRARIEMYLRAREAHSAVVGGRRIAFGRGELVLTEYSHKYTPESIGALMAGSGLCIRRTWHDSDHRYALVACARSS